MPLLFQEFSFEPIWMFLQSLDRFKFVQLILSFCFLALIVLLNILDGLILPSRFPLFWDLFEVCCCNDPFSLNFWGKPCSFKNFCCCFWLLAKVLVNTGSSQFFNKSVPNLESLCCIALDFNLGKLIDIFCCKALILRHTGCYINPTFSSCNSSLNTLHNLSTSLGLIDSSSLLKIIIHMRSAASMFAIMPSRRLRSNLDRSISLQGMLRSRNHWSLDQSSSSCGRVVIKNTK
ncbi:unnamed protein product [Moneuplotes crassus]|uniref:Uncharacterized protein n=1 Tax=Euplotes crassus TaxID=5936 RepID=A0AAD1UCS1_EUPCR|nr:unnamed protein product [Moneuplotes crassus]